MASILVDGLRLPVAVSGHPVLELCNTRAGWLNPEPKEYLRTYPHLSVWARGVGLVTPEACAAGIAAAEREPVQGAAVLRRALALRDALYGVLVGTGGQREWSGVGAEVGLAMAAMRIGPAVGVGAGNVPVPEHGEPAVPIASWVFGSGDALGAPLLACAWAAAGLLTTATAGDIRACPGNGCGWLFHDPRGRRRWCAMAWCGNREKARRHAQRSRPQPDNAGGAATGGPAGQPPR